MPSKLRRLSGREVAAILEGFGFQVTRIRGSDHIMQRTVEGKTQSVTVPIHTRRPLATGTLKNIYRQASAYIGDDELRPHFYSD
jgi:predicted RNA binding protein YcfA (HicA-like mRNA interferase family)